MGKLYHKAEGDNDELGLVRAGLCVADKGVVLALRSKLPH